MNSSISFTVVGKAEKGVQAPENGADYRDGYSQGKGSMAGIL